MKENPNDLDHELWLDQDIIPRQNRLKAKFWEILAEVANSVDSEMLIKIHAESRGTKLSKGNDLLGYPYQVLDLIRDFDVNDGLNIRVLNWFGHGLFIFILLGKNHPNAPFQKLNENSWLFDHSPTPWEYPEILLNNASTKTPTAELLEESTYYQWHKLVPVSGNILAIKAEVLTELNKLIFLLSEKMG
ncbi:hypothetical protein [Algoriphagus antarcticus]|uniref:Uncharacterized protein n=1 Tax=Algoriphagus antarcticus TaxID=238540 RepID=A0A3E0DV29_9BACT|nr:hypothetical protein [Algoriphagus antarcticus]REG88281.1 hypothetical protein C8N25_11059 [Algoriphagus antarcticus]